MKVSVVASSDSSLGSGKTMSDEDRAPFSVDLSLPARRKERFPSMLGSKLLFSDINADRDITGISGCEDVGDPADFFLIGPDFRFLGTTTFPAGRVRPPGLCDCHKTESKESIVSTEEQRDDDEAEDG